MQTCPEKLSKQVCEDGGNGVVVMKVVGGSF